MDRRHIVAIAAFVYYWFRKFLDDASTAASMALHSWMQDAQILTEGLDGRMDREVSIWTYNRPDLFMDIPLMGSYSNHMFKRRVRVSRATFHYICQALGPVLKREDTRMRLAVPVEKKVCIALSRLATGNTLRDIADSYGVGETTAQRAVVEFCSAVKEHIEPLCIRWPSVKRMERLAKEFEKMRGIPFVVGAVDGCHLPIIAPSDNPQDYFNRKGFHSLLLQVIVSSDCYVWDYDVGWAGSIHDWKLFQQSKAGQRIASGQLGKYCIVGDAAYPPRPWMLPPYKGHKDGLSDMQSNWNYVQSSTRMPVECTFGQLKARFRILMKRVDNLLHNVPDMVSACLVLRNLCIRHQDCFDDSWVEEATEEMQRSIENEKLTKRYAKLLKKRQLPKTEIAQAACYNIHRVRGVCLNPLEALERTLEEDDEGEGEMQKRMRSTKTQAAVAADNTSRRNAIAKALYDKKTAELVADVFGISSL